MGRKKCEVIGCTLESTRLRAFPNIVTERERCLKWIEACGNPELLCKNVYKDKKICDEHFENRFKLQSHLSKSAVPTLHLPEYRDLNILQQRTIETTETVVVMNTEVHTGLC
ncbi:uncharacterized protein LOC143343322 isoform X2 [Colletes latitarsis]|uniref:uncharacterized protein LOC143343322 isoform X2 n=1 Tax=Colletes latitarsis TaxID=2605962 RepID=UPI004036BD77